MTGVEENLHCYLCGGKSGIPAGFYCPCGNLGPYHAPSQELDLYGKSPYRADPQPPTTKAEELRQVAEDAVAEKLHQLVAALLKRATEAAHQGRTKTEWPWAAEPHQRLADVAEELHLLGFTCSITPDRESVRWFKAADPTLPIWTMEIAW